MVNEFYLDLLGTSAPSLKTEHDPTEQIETATAEVEFPISVPVSAPDPTVTTANFFRHPDTHPVALDLVLTRRYGPDWLGWEHETLEHCIPQDFKTPTVSDLTIAKIQAIKTLHLVDTYWQQWEVFGWITMPLNSLLPDFGVMQVPTVAQCALSVDTANRVRSDVKWSNEVKAYLNSVLRHDGILVPIAPLDFLDSAFAHLGLDDVLAEVKADWPTVRVTGTTKVKDELGREQLRRMLLVHNYLETSRLNLNRQLQLVPNV